MQQALQALVQQGTAAACVSGSAAIDEVHVQADSRLADAVAAAVEEVDDSWKRHRNPHTHLQLHQCFCLAGA